MASTTVTGTRTLWELIERRAASDPDRPMLVDETDHRVTFGQYRDRAERVAAGLAARGVVEGTPVSWQLPTRIDTVVLSGASVSPRCGPEPDHPPLPRS